MSSIFEDLNNRIVFTKVKSQSEALKLREEAREESIKKNVVIFFEKGYHTYLKPGQDPYQFRREVEAYLANPTKSEESTTNTSSETVTTKTTATSTGSKTKKSLFRK